jgi:hypothetical protein
MTSPILAPRRSPLGGVRAAIDAFNHGDIGALIPNAHRRRRRSAPDAAVTAIAERPLSVTHISGLDAHRVFCTLVTTYDSKLVGVYSLAHGRIAEARHYFSDADLLVSVGILDQDEAESAKKLRS